MEKTGLFTLTSGLHSEVIPDVSEEGFIREIAAAGADFDLCGEDCSTLHYTRRYYIAPTSQSMERNKIPHIL